MKLTLLSSASVGWVFKGGFSSLIKRIFLLKIGINEKLSATNDCKKATVTIKIDNTRQLLSCETSFPQHADRIKSNKRNFFISRRWNKTLRHTVLSFFVPLSDVPLHEDF